MSVQNTSLVNCVFFTVFIYRKYERKFEAGSLISIQGSRVRFPGTTKKVVGLERGPLSFVSTTEELLDRKVASPV
jgi:hypothetical protein